jgi:flagellar hook-length control protein FliK
MVRMQIMPEHLGRIDIEMLAGPDRHQVRLVTEHDAVRDTLVQSQVRLEQDLRQNGQRNTEVTVELRQQSPGAQGGSAQQQRGQSGADSPGNRDTAQRQNGTANADRTTPAPGRSRGNVRYA